MASQKSDALAEGRRIYIGNLHYVLKPNDIEEMLIANDFGNFENIHVSIDPVSGRNPGYCFVEFPDKETADRALRTLVVSLRGRQLKIGPCEPKKRGGHEGNPNFQRWGDWSPNKSGAAAGHEGSAPSRGTEGNGNGNGNGNGISNSNSTLQGNRAAIDHFDEMIDNFRGRRLYVGGLTRMVDQEQNIQEIREIFAGHTPEAIGKRITPHESTRSVKGNFHYCFVDFSTIQEAQKAVKALNGAPYKDGRLRVNMANRFPDHLNPRRSDANGSRNEDGEKSSSSSSSSSSWGPRTSGPRSENRERNDNPNNNNNNQRGEPGSRQEGSTRPHYSEGRARALASTDWRRKAPEAPAAEE